MSPDIFFTHIATLLRVLTKGADECLLRHILVKNSGDRICFKMIFTLRSCCQKADSLDHLCRLHSSGTSLGAGEAGEALVEAVRLKKRADVTVSHHIYKLMGMKIHLIIGRTSAGAIRKT